MVGSGVLVSSVRELSDFKVVCECAVRCEPRPGLSESLREAPCCLSSLLSLSPVVSWPQKVVPHSVQND